MKLIPWISLLVTVSLSVEAKVVETTYDHSSMSPNVTTVVDKANGEMVVVPMMETETYDDEDDFRNSYSSHSGHKPSYHTNKRPVSVTTSQCPPCVCHCVTQSHHSGVDYNNDKHHTNCGKFARYTDCVNTCSDSCDYNCKERHGCSPGCTCYDGYVRGRDGQCVHRSTYCDGSNYHHHHGDDEDTRKGSESKPVEMLSMEVESKPLVPKEEPEVVVEEQEVLKTSI